MAQPSGNAHFHDRIERNVLLMMVLSLAAIPLVLLLRKPSTPAKVDHSAVME